ncbi:small integral membrane protein 14-like [Antedon mediterranea]|uniref:small integral membrane protein 14-like n=1 Tax=Antedon mediterranea TaxID=105859 RepID=UPI003AF71628
MAEGGYDPCECIWSREGAMRRLISLLRNSQTTCTENECMNLQAPEGDGGYSFMMLMMGWIVLAVVLFLMRPNSMRNRGDDKPRNISPPPPPPAPSVD